MEKGTKVGVRGEEGQEEEKTEQKKKIKDEKKEYG